MCSSPSTPPPPAQSGPPAAAPGAPSAPAPAPQPNSRLDDKNQTSAELLLEKQGTTQFQEQKNFIPTEMAAPLLNSGLRIPVGK